MKLLSVAAMVSLGAALASASLRCTFAEEPVQDAKGLPAAQVVVVRATNGCFSEQIRVTGFLTARKQAIVTLDAPGYQVAEVLVAEGDQVKSGQALARLTRESGTAEPKPDAVKTEVKAPVSGLVIRSAAAIGGTASSLRHEPLFVIAEDNDIELEAEVSSIHLPTLSPGQRARAFLEDDRELSGVVRRVPASVDQNSQLGKIRIALDPTPGLRIGMFARATIDADRSCGISVPRAAVTYHSGGASVQVVRDNIVETRQVTVGLHSDTEAEIRSGLQEGDMVVASAGSALRNGDKVKQIVANATRTETP
jgi:multidrug efflux pump subunit AcrA (membrane-fusion protein)